MFKNKELKMLASDIDYACTKNDITLDDKIEIAKALTILGYQKIVWHKVADEDFPKTDEEVICACRTHIANGSYIQTIGSYHEKSNGDIKTSFWDLDFREIHLEVIAWTKLLEYKEN